jgi:hypothetical protein
VWQPTNAQWWFLLIVALLIVAVWPPADDRSLAVKFVNWAVDPSNSLPVLPDTPALGEDDDFQAVMLHDQMVRNYDEMYGKGGWSRMRLELKIAQDPFNPGTERQLLTALGVVAAFLVWRRRPSSSSAPRP